MSQKTVISLCFAFILFQCAPCVAQKEWKSSCVKGKSIIYKIRKNSGKIFIENSKNNDITKSHRQYNPDQDEFSNVRLTSQNAILRAFREVFTKVQIEQLASVNNYVNIFVDVDEKGQIIKVSFAMLNETSISPTEMESLEDILVKMMQFEVIGKKFDEHVFYPVTFRVSFAEIAKGEILMEHVRENVRVSN